MDQFIQGFIGAWNTLVKESLAFNWYDVGFTVGGASVVIVAIIICMIIIFGPSAYREHHKRKLEQMYPDDPYYSRGDR